MGLTTVFEISRFNCYKDAISDEEAQRRVREIEKFGFSAIISDFPYFTQKIKYLKYSRIAIGCDTWNAFINPKNYFDDIELRDFTVLQCIIQCKFYIFPRAGHEFVQAPFHTNVEYVKDFKPVNISSTDIRTKNDES